MTDSLSHKEQRMILPSDSSLITFLVVATFPCSFFVCLVSCFLFRSFVVSSKFIDLDEDFVFSRFFTPSSRSQGALDETIARFDDTTPDEFLYTEHVTPLPGT